MERHVVLIGEMGSGKTTLGRALSEAFGVALLDSVAVIESTHGRTGGEIAARDGVAALHRIERDTCAAMLDRDGPAVVCPAASVIEDPGVRARLVATTTVRLTAPVEVRARRLTEQDHRRRIDQADLNALADRRRHLYESVADLMIDTSSATVPDCVDQILRHLG